MFFTKKRKNWKRERNLKMLCDSYTLYSMVSTKFLQTLTWKFQVDYLFKDM
jgi:hypothetical protein